MNDTLLLKRIKDFLWVLFIAGMTIGVGRFVYGLAAATNMSDSLPWGLWKILNMVAGAALATSGFVVAAIIYIFQMDKYRPVARLSVLIGFLGYSSSLAALMFDIGLPHRGWHPFFMWNPHSFLFEVFWCVSCYWGITALEFLPIAGERFPFPKVTHFLHEIMLPFVVLGITLSTMHHSSLGSLFMASPTRLHPLWYSLWIPPEFFVSAMGAGLSMIVVIMLILARLYRQPLNKPVLTGLAKGSAIFLALYLVIKLADLTLHHKWNYVFGADVSWETYVFAVEITLQAILPVAILSIPALRKKTIALAIGTGSAFVGLVMQRLDTGIVGYFNSSHAIYIPTLGEIVLSIGLLAGTGLAFLFCIERFSIFDEPETGDGKEHSQPKVWTKAEAIKVFFGYRLIRVLCTLIVVIPLTWVLFRDRGTGPYQNISQPTSISIIGLDAMRTKLRINANANTDFVDFPHVAHQDTLMKKYSLKREETCVKCHHLSLPNDKNTICRACHRDMQLPTAMFSRAKHRDRFDSEKEYREFCEIDLGDRAQNYKACMKCHEKTMPGLTDYSARGFDQRAPGFKYAMHSLCQTCHRLEEKHPDKPANPDEPKYVADPAKPDSIGNCHYCHRQ